MKITSLFFVLFLVTSQYSIPPKKVMNAFKQKFPSATNIKWNQIKYKADTLYYDQNKKLHWSYNNKRLWQADFILGNRKADAGFTSDGNWIWSELEKSFADSREEVKMAIRRDFPNCDIVSIFIKEMTGLGSCYKVQVKCGEELKGQTYDQNGWPPPRI